MRMWRPCRCPVQFIPSARRSDLQLLGSADSRSIFLRRRRKGEQTKSQSQFALCTANLRSIMDMEIWRHWRDAIQYGGSHCEGGRNVRLSVGGGTTGEVMEGLTVGSIAVGCEKQLGANRLCCGIVGSTGVDILSNPDPRTRGKKICPIPLLAK